jgi:uncharacterized cupredoxin-like copper-binding protein
MRMTVVAAALLLAAACTRETPDVSQNTPSQSTTMTGAPNTETPMSQPTPESPSPGRNIPAAASGAQRVGLEEYQIRMEPALKAGKNVFTVANAGKEDHAFEIEGNGVHTKTEVLKRGDSTRVEVDLPPGTYTVYCPVDGHKDKGMRTTVTVQ